MSKRRAGERRLMVDCMRSVSSPKAVVQRHSRCSSGSVMRHGPVGATGQFGRIDVPMKIVDNSNLQRVGVGSVRRSAQLLPRHAQRDTCAIERASSLASSLRSSRAWLWSLLREWWLRRRTRGLAAGPWSCLRLSPGVEDGTITAGEVGASAASTRNPVDVRKIAADNTKPIECASPVLYPGRRPGHSLSDFYIVGQKSEVAHYAALFSSAASRTRSTALPLPEAGASTATSPHTPNEL